MFSRWIKMLCLEELIFGHSNGRIFLTKPPLQSYRGLKGALHIRINALTKFIYKAIKVGLDSLVEFEWVDHNGFDIARVVEETILFVPSNEDWLWPHLTEKNAISEHTVMGKAASRLVVNCTCNLS